MSVLTGGAFPFLLYKSQAYNISFFQYQAALWEDLAEQ
jgi:hypothetical protein